MLSNVRGICSPETFTALLAIFDSAWIEISSAPDFNQQTIEKAADQAGAARDGSDGAQ
jgi:O-succinylbenzoate synthase